MEDGMIKCNSYPYYIVAPDERENSAGIRALYHLCHAIIERGHEAFIVGGKPIDPCKTPAYHKQLEIQHLLDGRIGIAIYPEIISGNPLGATICVRYMMNKEGVIAGNRIDAGAEDLYFYFGRWFTPTTNYDIYDFLTIDLTDLNVFKPDENVKLRRPLLYTNRIPISKIDLNNLPSEIDIISNTNPLSLNDLARKLKEASVLYTFELSTTNVLAMLCGCPVIGRNLKDYEHLGFTAQNMEWCEGDGFTTIDSEDEIARAQATVHRIREKILSIKKQFPAQLDYFIKKTQSTARNKVASNPKIIEELLRAKENEFQDELFAPTRSLEKWITERQPNPHETKRIEKYFNAFQAKPSILIAVLNNGRTDDEVHQTIESAQAFGIPTTTINARDPAEATLENSGTGESNPVAVEGSLCTRLKSELRRHEANWLMLLHAGDILIPSGMYALMAGIGGMSGLKAVFGDEIKEAHQDGRLQASLRPDFDIDFLLGNPLAMTTAWIFHEDALTDTLNPTSLDLREINLDIILSALSENPAELFGHLAEPLIRSKVRQEILTDRMTSRIHNYLKATRPATSRLERNSHQTLRVLYGSRHGDKSSVSIILTIKDDHRRIQRFIEATLSRTTYQDTEIIISDIGSTDEGTKAWMSGIIRLGMPKIRVIVSDKQITHDQAWKRAFDISKGTHIILMEPSILPLSTDWIESLLNHASRPEVGCVSPKVISHDRTISSAGTILGLNGVFWPAFRGVTADDAGYMSRLIVDQSMTGLSSEVLCLKRELLAEILDAPADFSDHRFLLIDFCLRSVQAGYMNIMTPHARMMESVDARANPPSSSVLRLMDEDRFLQKWLTLAAYDPAYNRSLALREGGFAIEGTPGLSIGRKPWMDDAPRVLAFPADAWGCGHYRVIQPFNAMYEQRIIAGSVVASPLHAVEIERFDPDVVVLQRHVVDFQLDALKKIKKFSNALKIFELDDYILNLPLQSIHRNDIPKEISKRLRRALTDVDRFVVSTDALADAFTGLHPDIRVEKLKLPVNWWGGITPSVNEGRRPRVGWSGGSAHAGDLALIADVVKELASDVDWVFLGSVPSGCEAHIKEIHRGVAIEEYPAKLASLQLDLAIAPLEDNLFNRCKSNLKFLEYGVCGYPVIASDIECYRGSGLPVTLVKNRHRDWIDSIRSHLQDREECRNSGRILRSAVLKSWMLEGENLDCWKNTWTVK